MLDWLFIILGTFLITLSISKPFYYLFINKLNNIKFLNKYKKTTKIIFFIFGLILIFLGLFVESIK